VVCCEDNENKQLALEQLLYYRHFSEPVTLNLKTFDFDSLPRLPGMKTKTNLQLGLELAC